MSYVPLDVKRNRGWQWYDDGSNAITTFGSEFRHRYLAPCVGVSDNGHNYEYDCTASGSTSTTTTTDLCGRPFRPGSNFVVETASGLGVTCGGRPR